MKNKIFKMSLMLLFSIFSIVKSENDERIDDLLEEGHWGSPNGICDSNGCIKKGVFTNHAGINYGAGDKVPYFDHYKEIERRSLSFTGDGNDNLEQIINKKIIMNIFNYSYPNFLSQYKNLQQNEIDKIKKNIESDDYNKPDRNLSRKIKESPYMNDFFQKTFENENFKNSCLPNWNIFNKSLNDWGRKFTDNGWKNY